jgi:hypothetical protein
VMLHHHHDLLQRVLANHLPASLSRPPQVLSGHMSTRSCKPFAGTTNHRIALHLGGHSILRSSTLAICDVFGNKYEGVSCHVRGQDDDL